MLHCPAALEGYGSHQAGTTLDTFSRAVSNEIIIVIPGHNSLQEDWSWTRVADARKTSAGLKKKKKQQKFKHKCYDPSKKIGGQMFWRRCHPHWWNFTFCLNFQKRMTLLFLALSPVFTNQRESLGSRCQHYRDCCLLLLFQILLLLLLQILFLFPLVRLLRRKVFDPR